MRRLLLIVGIFLAVVILLLFGAAVYFNTPYGKGFLSQRVSSFATDYLKTNIRGKIDYRIPDWIVLQDFLIEDQQGDTLLAGKQLRLDLDMMALLQRNAKINSVELDNVRAELYRIGNSERFNYEFLIDAFTSDTTKTDTTKPALAIDLATLKAKDFYIKFTDGKYENKADLGFQKLNTGFNRLDIVKNTYAFKPIDVDGLVVQANIKAFPSNDPTKATTSSTSSEYPLQLLLETAQLNNARWDIAVAPSKLQTKGHIKSLATEVERIDLQNSIYVLKQLQIDAPLLTYNATDAPKAPKGLDFNHIGLKDLALAVSDLAYSPQQTTLNLKNASAAEQSGLLIQQLKGDVLYSDELVKATNFLLVTPHTRLSNAFTYVFPPAAGKQSTIDNAALTVQLRNSFIGVKDILLLAPDLAKNAYFKNTLTDRILIEGDVKGKVNDLTINSIALRGLNGSTLIGAGNVKGLPHTDRLSFNLNVSEFTATRKALNSFIPPDIAKQYGIPERLTLRGKLIGKLQDLTTDLTLQSTIGNASLAGRFRNITSNRPEYDGKVKLRDFDLNYLLKNDKFKKATLTADIVGTGFDPKTMKASITGTLNSAYFNGYDYQNVAIDADIKDQLATFKVASTDPNLSGRLEGTANLAGGYPSIKASGNFANLDLYKLKLYDTPLAIRGALDVQLTSTDPANPKGTINLANAVVDWGQGSRPLGDMAIRLEENEGASKLLTIKGDFLDLKLTGFFNYDALANVMLTEINRYFRLPDIAYTPTTAPTQFQLDGTFIYQPFLRAFVPDVGEFSPIKIKANFNNQQSESLVASVEMPYMFYDSMTFRQANLQLKTLDNKATYAAGLGQFAISGFQLQRATVTGDVQNDVASFQFIVKDSLNTPVHGLAGNLTSLPQAFRVTLNQEGALLAYNPWTAAGALEIHNTGFIADNIRFGFRQQELLVNSREPVPNAPVRLMANQIILKDIVGAFKQDTTLVSGLLDANVEVSDFTKSPTYTGDFTIRDLAVTQIPVGQLVMNAANRGSNTIVVDGSLTSEENDVRLTGDYTLGSNSPLDLLLDVRKISAKTIEAFSFGNLQRADGHLRGLVSIKGNTDGPLLKGDVFFDQFDFTVKQLGSRYKVANQQLNFQGKIVELDNFILSDSLGQQLVANGVINYSNLSTPSYRLTVTSQNFMAVDAPQGANDYFFGKGIVDSDLLISGAGMRYQIDGDVIVKPGSQLTLLMPSDEGGATEMQQVVKFIDRDAELDVEYETVLPQTSALLTNSSQVTVNIQADERSELSLLLDELTGDNLRVRGNGRLRAGINASGEVFMYGDYNITEGSYELTVQLLKKEFEILKGSNSYIRWTGDLMSAQMNVIAAYTTRTSLQKYVEGQSGSPTSLSEAGLRQNVPVTVLLRLENTLAQIKPTFEIAVNENVLPTIGVSNRDDLQGRWISVINNDGTISSPSRSILKENESYINQNAFFLIAFNRFFDGNINDLFSSGNAESFARQSVSALLSDQLDRFASSLIKGVDLDVGFSSDLESKSTSLNLGLSKAFFNDRIAISVGRNFELENAQRQSTELFDNIEANYKITKDGRYRLRAYRKNQYQTVLEGFVVETGIGFVVTLDYDRLLRFMARPAAVKKEEENEVKLED